jgi:hypothetical protein
MFDTLRYEVLLLRRHLELLQLGFEIADKLARIFELCLPLLCAQLGEFGDETIIIRGAGRSDEQRLACSEAFDGCLDLGKGLGAFTRKELEYGTELEMGGSECPRTSREMGFLDREGGSVV